MRLSANFELAELTVTSTGLSNTPNGHEIAELQALTRNVLQPLRDALGLPIFVSSGFRSARVNKAVGGASTSQHRLGQAADITVRGMTSREVCERIVALGLPFDQLIEEFGRWVHVSHGPRHRRQVLRAVKQNGRTAYLPGLA